MFSICIQLKNGRNYTNIMDRSFSREEYQGMKQSCRLVDGPVDPNTYGIYMVSIYANRYGCYLDSFMTFDDPTRYI